jgi:hypothetical protein
MARAITTGRGGIMAGIVAGTTGIGTIGNRRGVTIRNRKGGSTALFFFQGLMRTSTGLS